MRENDFWKKGNGSVFIGTFLCILGVLIVMMFTEYTNIYYGNVYTQTRADVLADAGAVYGNDGFQINKDKLTSFYPKFLDKISKTEKSAHFYDLRISEKGLAAGTDQVAITLKILRHFYFPTYHKGKTFKVTKKATTHVLFTSYNSGTPDPIRFPESFGLPCDPYIKNQKGSRSASAYLAVVGQFCIDTNSRYTPRGGMTFCNIFMQDVLSAMKVPFVYQCANDHYAWFASSGKSNGWKEVSMKEAGRRAQEGYPTIAVLRRSGHGHVRVIIPRKTADVKKYKLAYAQAGSSCYGYRAVNSFEEAGYKLYTHD